MKIWSVFRHEEEKSGFDPVLQYNPPSSIFTLSSESTHTSLIHLPCPVHQDFIDRVNIVPEFKGYLRSLGAQKHLYINLQDRTSWKEHTRAIAMEELAKTGEFVDVLQVITLAKSTDFYFQMNDYAELNHADEFCQRCVEQITEGSQYGFYLPESLMKRSQIEPLVNFVHEQFFEAKKTLTRKERLDFIEIFYFFVILKLVDQEKPDVVSFSCKDGVDTGAAMVAAFYGFSRMLSTSKPWTDEDKDFFIYAFFGPSFLVRNRSISPPIFQRSLSALDWFDNVIQGRRDKILKACAELFPELPFTQIKVA